MIGRLFAQYLTGRSGQEPHPTAVVAPPVSSKLPTKGGYSGSRAGSEMGPPLPVDSGAVRPAPVVSPASATADMLRRIAAFVESGQAGAVNFERRVTIPHFGGGGGPVAVRYFVTVDVVEQAETSTW